MSHFDRNAKVSQLEIPGVLPLMTLPQTVLFPQAMIPMHIFEPRYRKMLEDILHKNRLFALALQNQEISEGTGIMEPPHLTACVGMVRACQKNNDGSSNLILQGLARVRINKIVDEEPYRMVEIRPLRTNNSDAILGNEAMNDIRNLIVEFSDYFKALPIPFMQFVDSIQDLEAFTDVMTYTLCDDVLEKQRLLETLDTAMRAREFYEWLRKDIGKKSLEKRLQGPIADDRIGLN